MPMPGVHNVSCEIQRSIDKDSKMKEMIAKSLRGEKLVFAWMRDYGLFQGIKAEDRKAVVNKYFSTLPNLSQLEKGEEQKNIEENFRHLLSEFYSAVNLENGYLLHLNYFGVLILIM